MFLVLLFLTLGFHTVGCPCGQPRTRVMTHGGGRSMTPSPGFMPGALGASGGGNSGGTSPGAPPLGEALGTRTPGRLEGVYRPTAHEGAPARGDGPGSSLGEGCNPGSGEGPPTAVGGWRYNTGHSRRGAAAPPPTGCDRCGGRRTPPPPPPAGRAGAWGTAQGRALPVMGTATTGGAPAPDTEGPLPRQADLKARRGGDANRGPPSARGGPPAATDQSVWAHWDGGGSEPDRPGSILDTPGAGGGENGGGTSPGNPPSRVAPVAGAPSRLEGVYTPTAHEGAPGRGDGSGPPPEAGASPGSGSGPHAIGGGWPYTRRRSRRGTAAPPSARRGRNGDHWSPPHPPPPPPTGDNRGREGRRATRAAWARGGRRTRDSLPPTPTPGP